MRFRILSLVFLMCSGGVAYSGPKGGHGDRKVFEKLDLSAEQKAQMKTLREERKKSIQPLKAAVKQAKANLDSALDGESADEVLKTAHSDLVKKRNDLDTRQFEHMLKVRAILTPEQRKTFSSIRPRGKHGHESGDKDSELAPNYE